MKVSRRAVIAGGLGLVVTGCGETAAGGGRTVSGAFSSAAMAGDRIGWTIGYPPGHSPGERLPVVVALHGRNATHRTAFTTLGLGGVLSELVGSGAPAFALASVDGGAASYWHRRADGRDPEGMLVREFLPLLHGRGLDVSRLGLYGWSMGGYGALLLAGRSPQLRVRAVAVASPALFTSAGTTPAGAYDDAADYARNNVYAHPEWLRGMPLWIDCGTADPFYEASRAFVGRLAVRPSGGFTVGGHTPSYWRKVAPAELRFLGRHLS